MRPPQRPHSASTPLSSHSFSDNTNILNVKYNIFFVHHLSLMCWVRMLSTLQVFDHKIEIFLPDDGAVNLIVVVEKKSDDH